MNLGTDVRARPSGWARTIARRVGLDVRRYRPERSATARRALVLQRTGIDTVLDVGASIGQYARELRLAGFRGRIVSFEPLPGPFAELARRAAGDPRWECRRAALGDSAGTATLHVAGNSLSSSLLPMTERHAEALPGARAVSTEEVPVTTLDALAPELLLAGDRVLLKIDVQGYERRVLDGARATLDSAHAVELELSLVELYDGQPLMCEMIGHLEELGFTCVGLEPEFTDPATGAVLQLDGLFVRDPR